MTDDPYRAPRIRVVDLETNGLAPPAEVLEAGWCDLELQPEEGPAWVMGVPGAQCFGCSSPLDPVARATHHIDPSELADRTAFDAARFLDAALASHALVIASHNWRFEERWLAFGPASPLKAICTYKAALRVYPEAPSHGLAALTYWLQDRGAIDIPDESPDDLADDVVWAWHRAAADAWLAAHLLRAMLLTGATGRDMALWTKQPALLPHIPIGKQRGAKWCEVEGGFLTWMVKQPDMEFDLKWNAQRELDRRVEAGA